MAISKVELINKALTLCGANPITSIDDSSNNARIVNRVYESSLRSILSECKWSFATKRRLLSKIATADEPEWSHTNEAYYYQVPADVIRIFGSNDSNAEWRLEGDMIASDTDALGIEYVYFHEDPSKYSASFIEALADKLCADISFMILNSGTKAQAFMEKYNQVSLSKAMAENAQIGTQQVMKDDAWENSKYNNSQPFS